MCLMCFLQWKRFFFQAVHWQMALYPLKLITDHLKASGCLENIKLFIQYPNILSIEELLILKRIVNYCNKYLKKNVSNISTYINTYINMPGMALDMQILFFSEITTFPSLLCYVFLFNILQNIFSVKLFATLRRNLLKFIWTCSE